jgi:hypothetical protein
MKKFLRKRSYTSLGTICFVILLLASCSSDDEVKEEQIRVENSGEGSDVETDTAQANAVQGNMSMRQLAAVPNSVVLTGMPQHRLITVYKTKRGGGTRAMYYRTSSSYYYEESEREGEEHFMPGIDLIRGYNLVNIAHYDMATEKLTHLFEHPVLVRSVYYPSFHQDSLYKKPVNRDYYLISVYDTDTNSDTLINKKDLRRFYCFNATCSEKIQLIPTDYYVVRSQYDPKNDVMFVFAQQDTDNNGTTDKKEPLHIFWFNLKKPDKAKRLY